MMKRILLYDGKNHKMVYDASTTELAEQAMAKLFKYLDSEGYKVYSDLRLMESLVYKRAKEGDIKAITRLLQMRRNCEYEYWEFINVTE